MKARARCALDIGKPTAELGEALLVFINRRDNGDERHGSRKVAAAVSYSNAAPLY
jgi:hypothetical protein